jgi:hypothetical protein
MAALIFFLLAFAYALWLLGWRCRPGNLWTDVDGINWTGRATLVVILAILAVWLAAFGLWL